MPANSLKAITEEAQDNVAAARVSLGSLPEGVSVSDFLTSYSAVGELDHYRFVPDAAAHAVQRVVEELGAEAARTFLRVALGQGIVALADSGRLNALPERIVRHHARQLKRIAGAIAADANWFDLSSDLFLKDCGLVSLRLYAAAAQLLDTRCGIPRSIIVREGVLGTPRHLFKILRMRGFKPYAQIHTHLSNLEDFNEEGWNECYRCCADLYEARPDILGMFGSSWFYDPAVTTISPRLGYLREVPMAGGAELFFFEKGGSAIGNAISTSESRRRLYEEGKYMPTSYMLAWGRDAQIAWARRNPGGCE